MKLLVKPCVLQPFGEVHDIDISVPLVSAASTYIFFGFSNVVILLTLAKTYQLANDARKLGILFSDNIAVILLRDGMQQDYISYWYH